MPRGRETEGTRSEAGTAVGGCAVIGVGWLVAVVAFAAVVVVTAAVEVVAVGCGQQDPRHCRCG